MTSAARGAGGLLARYSFQLLADPGVDAGVIVRLRRQGEVGTVTRLSEVSVRVPDKPALYQERGRKKRSEDSPPR